MKAIIKNFETQEILAVCGLNTSKADGKSFDNIMRQISKIQEEENFLHLDTAKEKVVPYQGFGFGIKQCYEADGVFSSAYPVDAAFAVTHTGRTTSGLSSSIVGSNSGNKVVPPEKVKVKNLESGEERELDLQLEVIAYPEGYVLSTGKRCHNIFGGSHPAYFSKITSRNFKSASKGDARLFATPDAAKKYIEKNRSTFEYMVTQYGYCFDVEPANKFFEQDEEKKEGKQKEKLSAGMASLKGLLAEINEKEEEEEEVIFPEVVTDAIMQEEAISRMKNMGLMDEIVNRYAEKGVILFSEFGGILYDLNDEAKKAVAIVREEGFLPYHVIRSQTEFGDCYAVLYVSKDAEEWIGERRNKHGEMLVYVYNATDPTMSEYGYIVADSCNGGLQRTA